MKGKDAAALIKLAVANAHDEPELFVYLKMQIQLLSSQWSWELRWFQSLQNSLIAKGWNQRSIRKYLVDYFCNFKILEKRFLLLFGKDLAHIYLSFPK